MRGASAGASAPGRWLSTAPRATCKPRSADSRCRGTAANTVSLACAIFWRSRPSSASMPPEETALEHAVLRLENLSKRYGERAPLFEGLQLTLMPGEYLAVMGESGVGKSTLLNVLA